MDLRLEIPSLMHIPIRRFYFKVRGVKKDSVPYMVKVELKNIPVKCGIVYPDVVLCKVVLSYYALLLNCLGDWHHVYYL